MDYTRGRIIYINSNEKEIKGYKEHRPYIIISKNEFNFYNDRIIIASVTSTFSKFYHQRIFINNKKCYICFNEIYIVKKKQIYDIGETVEIQNRYLKDLLQIY